MTKPKLTPFQKELIKENLPAFLKSIGIVTALVAQWNLEHIGWKTITEYETTEVTRHTPEIRNRDGHIIHPSMPYTTTELRKRTRVEFCRLKTPETSDLDNTPVSVPILSMLYRLGDFGVDSAEQIGNSVGGLLSALGFINMASSNPMPLLKGIEKTIKEVF